MGDILRFPHRAVPASSAPAPLPPDGFADGDRVWDKVTGQRGTVRGRYWGGAGIEVGRPLKYAVAWDGEAMLEDVVACRLVPARPMLAARRDGDPSLTTLHVRRITRAPWWPGKSLLPTGSGGRGDEPEGAA